MDIESFGGEFRLIEAMTADFPNLHDALVTVGDDCAVVPTERGDFRVFTTDMLLEDKHFRLSWTTPEELGTKLVEVNVSDIAAMGAVPEFLLLNVGFPRTTEAEFVLAMYDAIRAGCRRHRITMLGGDTTRSEHIVLSATVTGRTTRPILRSTARVGDLIAVTGDVGAAAAAIVCLRAGQRPSERVRLRHTCPRARVDVAETIARYATAMLDVSDGVASEVRHIVAASRVGARVDAIALPVREDAAHAARLAGVDALTCALSGGEDFELLFTLPRDQLEPLRNETDDVTVIGEILPPEEGMVLRTPSGAQRELPGGYDHFAGGP